MEYAKMKLTKDSMGFEFATNTIMKGKEQCGCIICHKPTFFIDVLSETHICSEECSKTFNKQYNEYLQSMDETIENTLNEMKDDEYCLSFTQVLDEMFRTQNNKIKYWYQGKDFQDGYFLELNEYGIVRLSAFTESSFVKQDFGNPILSKGMYTQKYRRVSTQPDVMRKIFD